MSKHQEEYDLFKWHPEILLISKDPPTFEGFLTVPENCYINAKTFLKIKLIVPLFPMTSCISVSVTDNLELLSSTDFKKIILSLLQNGTSLCSFLKQLKECLIVQTEKEFNHDACSSNDEPKVDESMINRYWELRDLLKNSLELQILSNYNLKIIKLSANGVTLIAQNDVKNFWNITYSDIPSLLEQNSVQCSRFSLNSLCNLFTSKLEDLKTIWEEFQEIDKYCWVIDPLHPKPYHLYRRIYLTRYLSVIITVNPSYLEEAPEIKFLGCESTISEYREKVTDKLKVWDSERTLLQNLSLLLNIDTFPQAPKTKVVEVEEGIVNDEDCCICFLQQLDDGQLPNLICGNVRCGKQYHLNCLQQWLVTISGNTTAFNQIHGECPHCGENISCVL